MNEVILRQAPKTGYAYAVRLPYRHLPFVKAFKDLVPEPSRDWHPPMASWVFRSAYLEPVRQLVGQFASQEGWRIVDCTALAKEEAQRVLEAFDQQLYEEHVHAVLQILARIPAGALALAGWFPDRIVLDLYERLDDADLFRELMRLERPHWVARVSYAPYIPSRTSQDPRVIVAGDMRIIGALCEHRVRHLELVGNLTPTQLFADGIAYFQDEQGALWFGAPPALALKEQQELYEPTDTYQVAQVGDDQLYLVARAADCLPRLMKRAVSPGVIVLSKFQPRVPLYGFLQRYHLLEWFKAWANTILASEELRAVGSPEPRSLWESTWYWVHPADDLLAYLRATHSEEVQVLLGWSDDHIRRQQERIGQLKEGQRHAHLRSCQEHAIELVRPLLERKVLADLFALGEHYAIPIRSSWPSARRIQELLSHGEQSKQLAWDLLGIPLARNPE